MNPKPLTAKQRKRGAMAGRKRQAALAPEAVASELMPASAGGFDFSGVDAILEGLNLGSLDDGDREAPAGRQTAAKLCPRCGEDMQSEAQCLRRTQKDIYRRAFSESSLLEILPVELEPGASYHCISGGDVDSLSYLKHILRQQPLDYVLFSTWCMALDDILQFKEWLAAGKIKRLDAYVGEIFPGSYSREHTALKEVIASCQGRVCVFRNHAKVYAGTGPKFAFAIESSANVNTNPRTENTVLTIGPDIFHFYKDFFDGVTSFSRDFDQWRKWE